MIKVKANFYIAEKGSIEKMVGKSVNGPIIAIFLDDDDIVNGQKE